MSKRTIGRCKKDDRIASVDKDGYCKDHAQKKFVELFPGVRFYNKANKEAR